MRARPNANSETDAWPAVPRPDHGRDEGGDPVCWAHLFDDEPAEAEGTLLAGAPILKQKLLDGIRPAI